MVKKFTKYLQFIISAIQYLLVQVIKLAEMLDKFFNVKQKTQKMQIQGQPRKQDSLMPWVQKYRPNKLDQLSYQQEVTATLKNVLKTGNLPHLLFYGPAGTGKTSAIIALSKQLYGPKFYKERVLQLNASDDRGITVVRQKVKTFAQQVCTKNPDKNYICPNYKIIILDEADLMTNTAQSALRRVIQDNSNTTRFCIICNYITKIIEPVSSRCVKFRFKPIPLQVQLQKLQQICTLQNVKLHRKELRNLLEKGDLRQSINSLQTLHLLTNIPPNLLPTPNEYCQDLVQKIFSSKNILEVYQIAKQVGYEQYPMDEVLSELVTVVIKRVRDQRKKAMMMEIISKCQQNLLAGATQLQHIDVLTSLYYVFHTSF